MDCQGFDHLVDIQPSASIAPQLVGKSFLVGGFKPFEKY